MTQRNAPDHAGHETSCRQLRCVGVQVARKIRPGCGAICQIFQLRVINTCMSLVTTLLVGILHFCL